MSTILPSTSDKEEIAHFFADSSQYAIETEEETPEYVSENRLFGEVCRYFDISSEAGCSNAWETYQDVINEAEELNRISHEYIAQRAVDRMPDTDSWQRAFIENVYEPETQEMSVQETVENLAPEMGPDTEEDEEGKIAKATTAPEAIDTALNKTAEGD